MSDCIQIRQAQESDAEAVLRYVAELIAERPPTLCLPPAVPTVEEERNWMRRYILPPRSTLLLAFSGDRVIGVLECRGDAGGRGTGCGKFGMSVSVEFRNRGVGRMLVSMLLEWAGDKAQFERVELEVHACNDAAMALYSKMGFSEQSRKKDAACVSGNAVDIIRMSREVVPPDEGIATRDHAV